MADHPESYDANFIYFKESGKYYTEGQGKIPGDPFMGLGRDRITPLNDGKMPGMAGRADDFFVVILVDGNCPPYMLPPGR